MRSRKRQAIGSKESRRTERRRRKARALNDSIEMGLECGEVERGQDEKGPWAPGYQDAVPHTSGDSHLGRGDA